ncbi:MAG TPA: DUF1688 family protein [Casimicrobiaceae bacterium]|nr:DUF1688 family protein [Casimicrobiaceae bacterium]
MTAAALGRERFAPSPVTELHSLVTVRERCGNIARAVEEGRTSHFRVQRDRLDDAATLVADVTRERYPDLRIPGHSRWRHFDVGGIDRKALVDRELAGASSADIARARIDLAVISVLLDAGAGPQWHYREAQTGNVYARSEGLAVATLRAFLDGAFSSRPDEPCRVDALALSRIDDARLARIFQVTRDNPIVGLSGRVALLRRLAHALADESRFGVAARPGALFDVLTRGATVQTIEASAVVAALLARLNDIWLTGSVHDGVPLGDTWRHPAAGGAGSSSGWVPFHKLTQWLAYSLFEPVEWAGVQVEGQDALTALPEYRNGGLLLDSGVIALVDDALAIPHWSVGSALVVEWRALTVTLIDELAARVRTLLRRPDLPLACVLEGGTWAAGRQLASQRRDGAAPLAIDSDGTVF